MKCKDMSDTHHIAAGPPAKIPRKNTDLGIALRYDKLVSRSQLSPNTANEVQRTEASGEAFELMPCSMELLQKSIFSR